MNRSWRWNPFSSVASVPSDDLPGGESLWLLNGDEELSDVKMQGSNGGIVVAVKAILSVRSPVFRNLFYGSQSSKEMILSEGKDLIIFKEWDSRTLKLLVEFCYTDNISAMKAEPTDCIARSMANLRSASKAFKLQVLLHKVDKWSSKQVRLFPALACALIDEGMKKDDIDKTSLEIIRLKSKDALLPETGAIGGGVSSLTEPTLLFVLRTIEDSVSHQQIVDCISRWAEFSKKDCEEGINHTREAYKRKIFARKCSLRFVKFPDSDRSLA